MGLEPVQVEQRRECHFKAKACASCGLPKSNPVHAKRGGTCHGPFPRGCDRCGRNKGDVAHFGAPPSYNAFGSGRGTGGANMVGASLLNTWKDILRKLIKAAGMPKDLSVIYAEGEIVFPTRGDRDQGNFRVIIEKALGDVLESEGYLPNDSWEHYEFGNLTMRIEPGVSATRLTLFPSAQPRPQFNEQLEIA